MSPEPTWTTLGNDMSLVGVLLLVTMGNPEPQLSCHVSVSILMGSLQQYRVSHVARRLWLSWFWIAGPIVSGSECNLVHHPMPWKAIKPCFFLIFYPIFVSEVGSYTQLLLFFHKALNSTLDCIWKNDYYGISRISLCCRS